MENDYQAASNDEESVPYADTVRSYHSSNKVNLLRFIPLLMLASFVTLLMSVVLLFADSFYYLFVIMPIVIGLPVAGMIYTVIRVGHCRNRILAVTVGVLLMLQFYLGFWGLGYMAFIAGSQDFYEGNQYLVTQTGSSGVWGYFKYHCQSNIVEDTTMPASKDEQPDSFDKYSSYSFYAMELIFLVCIGYACANNLSQRLFYEKRRQWSTCKSVCFLPDDLAKLMDIVHSRNWGLLEEMTHFGKLGNQQTSFAELTIEYCKKSQQEPVYISVKGSGLSKVARQAGIIGKGLLQKTYIRQYEMSPETIYELDRVLGGFKILPETAAQTVSETVLATDAAVSQSIPSAVPVGTESQAKGLEKQDFRQAAVDESLRLTQGRGSMYLHNANMSVCLPLEPEDCVSVKKTALFPLIFIIIGLLSIFGGLGIAIWGSELTLAGTEDISPAGYVLITVGICIFLSSFFFLFFSKMFQTRRMKRTFLERPGALFEDRKNARMIVSNIEDSKTYHVFKLSPDDVGLICFDPERQRLLIEGCSHRYVICGPDVLQIAPLQGMSENVVNLCYEVGNARLSFTMTCESLKKAFLNQTIFGLVKGRSSNKFADELRQLLGIETSTQ